MTIRREQIQTITDTIGNVLAGKATTSVVFVTGEAGIGKTTILREVAATLGKINEQVRATVASTQCSTPLAGRDIGEVESLQPWAGLMAQLLESSAKDVVEKKKTKFDFAKFFVDTAPAWVTMVPLLGPSVGAALEIVGATYDQYYFNKKMNRENASQNAANQQQVFQQYINFLAQVSAQQPLVLVIDDFHWADTSSTNLLFTAARELQGKPVVFLIAYRADDAMSSRGGEGHPLLHIHNELQRYNLAMPLAVPRFTSEELDALLRSRYSHYQNNDAFEEWLARAGSGNALFITQFLATLEEDGYIDTATGAIREGFESARVPASAQAVVQERIRRLSEDTREMLRYASVEGDVFTTAVLAGITDTPQLKLLQRLRIAEETHHFIHSLGKQRLYARETTAYKFTHALLHKVLYDSLGEEERELLHEAVFDILKSEWESALQAQANIEGMAARLAVHAEILGHHLFAAQVFLEGARAAWKEYAEEETLRLLGLLLAALDRTNSSSDSDTLRAQALLLRAYVHRLNGRPEIALSDLSTAEQHSAQAPDGIRIDILNLTASIQRMKSNTAVAREKAGSALVLAQEVHYPKGIFDALTSLGHIKVDDSKLPEALELYTRALDTAQQAGESTWQASALDNIGIIHSDIGNYAEALEYYNRSMGILEELGDNRGRSGVLTNLGTLYYQIGERDRAYPCFEESAAISRSIGDIHGEANNLNNIGALKVQEGEFESALHYYRQSYSLHERIGFRRGTAAALDNIGQALQGLNRYEEALDCHTRALAEQEQTGDRYSKVVTLHNIGILYRRTNRTEDSVEYMEKALEVAQDIAARDLAAEVMREYAQTYLLAARAEHDSERRTELFGKAEQLIEQSLGIFRSMNRPEAQKASAELEAVRAEMQKKSN